MKRRTLVAAMLALAASIFVIPADRATALDSRDGRIRVITVVNSSHHTVNSIHAVPARAGAAYVSDPDLIPGYTIGPGQHSAFPVDNGHGDCVYNLLAVSSTGLTWINQIDVCRGFIWTLVN